MGDLNENAAANRITVRNNAGVAESDLSFTFSGSTMGNSIGVSVDWEGTTTDATTVQFKIDSLFGSDINVDVDIAAGLATSADVAEAIFDQLVDAGLNTLTDNGDTYTLTRSKHPPRCRSGRTLGGMDGKWVERGANSHSRASD